MASRIEIEFKFPDLAGALRAKKQEILLFLAAQIQTNRGLMFDDENAGRTPWKKPLLRDGQALSQKGTLRKSFAPRNNGIRPGLGPEGIVRISGDVVTIGTKLAKADILNRGGIIRPVRAKVLWIPLPAGKANSSNAPSKTAKGLKSGSGGAPVVKGKDGKFYLLAKQAVIPARPMDEWTSADEAELSAALTAKIEEVLNGIG